MHLSALELSGFKSFAKKTELTFGPGITCIVGPNGSGKSGIADAIRWVLGEQSLKSIRAKRGEDVIFAGSRARSRLGFAEVSLSLADAEAAGLDTPELALTRTIDRSGESAYLVNGHPVRLLDLAELLARAGFAQKSYTVIPQGMIDAFVLASPLERRQMFEDATGVTPLLFKQQQTERKLEATRVQIARGRDLLRELEPRLRSLKRQAGRARSRAEIEAHLQETEETSAALRWRTHAGALEVLEENIRGTDQRIQTAAVQLEGLRGSRGGSALREPERLPELRRAAEDLRVQERDLLLALARAEVEGDAEVDRVAEEIAARRKEQEKLTHELSGTRSALSAAPAELAAADPEHSNIGEKLVTPQSGDRAPDGFDEIREMLRGLRAETSRLAARLRAATTSDDLPTLRAAAEDVERGVGAVAGFVDRLRAGAPADTRAIGERLRQLAEKQSAHAQRAAALQVREAELRERLRAVEERLGDLQRRSRPRRDTAEVPADELRRRFGEIQQRLSAASSEVSALEDALLRAHLQQEKTAEEEQRMREALRAAEQEKAALAAERAATSARLEDLFREAADRLGGDFAARLRAGEAPVPPNADAARLREQTERLRKQLFDIGGIDTTALEEENAVGRRVTELRTHVADLDAARKNLGAAIRELERHVHERFSAAFRAMDQTFNRTFRDIFGGGRASLSLVKPKPIEHAFPDLAPEGEEGPRDLSREAGAKWEAPSGAEWDAVDESHVHELPAGVEIHVHPPGKKLSSLAQLSGGEKALTSIALLFAILENRASPFVVLDEVDAALDEANSRRFAQLLQEAAKRTQFIVITHNRATMEAATALYGVTMGDDGVSQLLSVKLEEVPAEAARGHAAA